MRHKIESDGLARSQADRARVLPRAGFAFGLALTATLMVTARASQAERVGLNSSGSSGSAYQSGMISGVGSHAAAAPKAVPPHSPGYLGILFQNLSDEQMAALHLKSAHGVEIVMVDHDGPAGKVGLQPRDVIVSLNGQMITGAEGLRRMIHDAGVGTDVALTVIRGGRQMTLNVQLAYRGEVEREAVARMVAADTPAASGVDPVVEGAAEGDSGDPVAPGTASRSKSFLLQMIHSTPFTGLMLEGMEPQLAGFFGAPAGVGLLVETVTPNSPAAAAGLRAGDVIVRADSIELKTTGEWVRRLHASRGRGIALRVLRDKQEQRMMLIPELKKHSEVAWPMVPRVQPALA